MNDFSRPAAQKIERILVLDPQTATAKMLASLLRSAWPHTQVYGARDAEQGMLLAVELTPQLVFVDMSADFDGMAFARTLRRSDFACREAPLIMISSEATAALILGARDAGVHEFMRRPYTMGDLQKRLDAISGKPRDWIEAIQYVGPDRRRFNSADYKGPRKRRTDSQVKAQRMSQALKIVQSAARAVDSDPVQAARALATQARMLIELSAGQEQYKRLGVAAVYLQTYLQSAAVRDNGLNREQVETFAANLIQVAPEDVKPKAA